MKFQTPLIPARLIRRYKRFLADIELDDGSLVTAHCANPGAMTGLMDPGARIWVERNDDPKRKLRYSWKLLELAAGGFACIDTALPNRLVEAALRAGDIQTLAGYDRVRPEVKYGQSSRIDFLLSGGGQREAYVEVKAVSLCRQQGLAEFPDSVTKRGTKHLFELMDMVSAGHRAVMLYVVQRTDCARFSVAGDIDPAYGAAFQRACAAGGEAYCHATKISPERTTLAGPLMPALGNNFSRGSGKLQNMGLGNRANQY